MLTGWIHHRHRIGRVLSRLEFSSHLDRERRSPVLPDERANLLRLNSVYAEFIDSRFLDRGFPTLTALIFVPVLLLAPLCSTSPLMEKWWIAKATSAEIFTVLFFGFLGFVLAFLLWQVTARRDICTYTHYPIRFNRKTRMIYAFRHNDPGGVLSVPWEKAFFFIGRGQGGERNLLELRCHVLGENNLIVDTFSVGHDDTSPGGILEVWEMIRLYMEEGPQSVPQYPVFLFPQRVTWRESWTVISARVSGAGMMRLIATSPSWSIRAVMHYFVLRTCKTPVWPREVEEACRFLPDDPYQLPEERYESDHPCSKEVWRTVSVRRQRNREVLEKWEREQGIVC